MEHVPTYGYVMSYFDQYIQYRLLDTKFRGTVSLGDIAEEIGSDTVKVTDSQGNRVDRELRNVCAKVPVSLVDRLDNTLALLGISKREFVEMAIIEALDKVDKIEQEVDVFEGRP